MTGQIDIGWAAPPFGLKELNEGKIRIIARGSDVPSLRGQTVRVLIANAGSLESKKDAIVRFVKGYRDAVDWMYADPAAVAAYAKKIESSPDIVRQSISEFQPKATQQTDELKDLDGAMRDAVKLKFLEAPLTPDQLKVFVQIPPK
jgi:NitT/TauT family transport system substrate-binding protein